ncbi:MAG: nitroreductase/quinone reductase family protein [Anaerolineae bacterium]
MIDSRPDEDLLVESRELVLISADRSTGDPQETTLRFAYEDGVVYLLATASKATDWYRNLEKDRGVVVRVKRRGFRGRAKLYDAKQRSKMARQIAALFRKKYGAGVLQGTDPDGWLPVTIDIQF